MNNIDISINYSTKDTSESGNQLPENGNSVYDNPVPGPSGLNTNSNQIPTPETIRPLPKAAPRTKKITRKTRKSAILTDTPEKNALAEEQKNKNKKN